MIDIDLFLMHLDMIMDNNTLHLNKLPIFKI